MGHLREKVREVLDQAQKPLNLIMGSWGSPFQYPGHFVVVSVESTVIDTMTQAVHAVGI
jgi:hypothetical protein